MFGQISAARVHGAPTLGVDLDARTSNAVHEGTPSGVSSRRGA